MSVDYRDKLPELDGASFHAGSSLPDGRKVLVVSLASGDQVSLAATDAEWQGLPALLGIGADTTPPVTTITSGPPTGSSTSASFALAATEAATFQYQLDGGAWTACAASFTLTGLPVGAHTLLARATDTAGNVGQPASWNWTITAVVASVKPKIWKYMLKTVTWTLPSYANKWDVVVIQNWMNGYIPALKAANPNVRVLAYQDATMASPMDGTGKCSSGVSQQDASAKGYLTGVVNSYGLSQCDIRKPGYVADWLAGASAHVDGKGFDGIFMDDFNNDSYWQPSLAGPAWTAALHSLAQAVSAHFGWNVANMDGTWGQHPDQDQFLPDLDGGIDEFCLTWPGGAAVSQQYDDNALASMAHAAAQGKMYLAQTVLTSTSDTQRALAGYCFACIGGATHYCPAPDPTNTPSIYLPEFDINLGAPAIPTGQAGYYTKSGSVYTRHFANKTVTVNVSTLVGTIA